MCKSTQDIFFIVIKTWLSEYRLRTGFRMINHLNVKCTSTFKDCTIDVV